METGESGGLEGQQGSGMDGQGLVWEESNSVEFCPLEQDVCVGSALLLTPTRCGFES